MSIDPATLSAISIATSVIGGGITAVGQIQQGQAAKQQAAYQAAVARNNAIIAQRQADDARARGEAEARKQALRTRQLIGRQRATLAANGVLVDQDSALDITSDTAALGKLDELTIRSNAEREALGFQAQQANFLSDAGLADATGRASVDAARSAAFGTLLTTAGSVSDKWFRFRNEFKPRRGFQNSVV